MILSTIRPKKVSGDPTNPKYSNQPYIFSFLKKVRRSLVLILDYFCLNARKELANQTAVIAFTVAFDLIFLLNNNFILQFLYSRHFLDLKSIWKNKNNSLPADPIKKSEDT
jgi:hypothetical protein